MNGFAAGRDVAERVDVRHHVVPEATLVRGDGVEVDVVEVRAHLRDRLVGNRHAELLLGLGEREPERRQSPWRVRGDQSSSIASRRVALGERRGVGVVHRHWITNSVREHLPAALEEHHDATTSGVIVDRSRGRFGVGDWYAIDLEDHVAGLNAELIGHSRLTRLDSAPCARRMPRSARIAGVSVTSSISRSTVTFGALTSGRSAT